jgi:uncharacterized Ntn-hydrolase superfamily protein
MDDRALRREGADVTFSIVARDAETGQLGVAVQSFVVAVGNVVPWARPGVGAVATQAVGEPAYGPRCLDVLAAGASAPEALAAASDSDPMADFRQVGVVGADGSAAVSTGSLTIAEAGEVVGSGVAVQANMMSNRDVWPAMAAAFETASGPLAHRLLAALRAGEAAGGDARGSMSAALLVVEGEPAAAPGGGVVVDLRVDRHDAPIEELGRLLVAAEVYAERDQAIDQLVGGDPAAALATVEAALQRWPGERNVRFVRAGALAGVGAVDAAVAELRSLVAERPSWEVVIRSFVDKGLVAMPGGLTMDDVLA